MNDRRVLTWATDQAQALKRIEGAAMRLPRRPRYSVVDPRTGRPVVGRAKNKAQAYELAEAFGPGLWVVKVR